MQAKRQLVFCAHQSNILTPTILSRVQWMCIDRCFYARNHFWHTSTHEVDILLNHLGTGVSRKQDTRYLSTGVSRRQDINHLGTRVSKRRDTSHLATDVSRIWEISHLGTGYQGDKILVISPQVYQRDEISVISPQMHQRDETSVTLAWIYQRDATSVILARDIEEIRHHSSRQKWNINYLGLEETRHLSSWHGCIGIFKGRSLDDINASNPLSFSFLLSSPIFPVVFEHHIWISHFPCIWASFLFPSRHPLFITTHIPR